MDAQLAFLPEAAVAALSAKLAEWQADTAVFTSRLTEHAQAFNTSAATYDTTDQSNAELLDGVRADGSLRFI